MEEPMSHATVALSPASRRFCAEAPSRALPISGRRRGTDSQDSCTQAGTVITQMS